MFLTITKTVGELFRDEFVFRFLIIKRNEFVKQAMLQTLGHLIAIVPEHFHVDLNHFYNIQISDDLKTRYLQLENANDDLPNNLYGRCCAFYFPAVLKSISETNRFWEDTNGWYSRLSYHQDSITCRSLAYSLHVVAEIIGSKNTEKFLLPIQERFLGEKDDVRTGVIKNMAKLWRFFSPERREEAAKVLSPRSRDLPRRNSPSS